LTLTPTAEIRETPVEVDLGFTVSVGPEANPRLVLRATGYNSLVSQTDSTPFITATGARTPLGVVAVSRALLGASIPYGALMQRRDLGSYYTGRGAGSSQHLLESQ